MIWVVVREELGWFSIHGPFTSAARASGYGWQKYGAIQIGNRWHVRAVRP